MVVESVALRSTSVVVLGVLSLLVAYGFLLEAVGPDGRPLVIQAWLVMIDLNLGALAICLYPLRHRWPLRIVTAIVDISALSLLAAGACAFGVVSLATRRQWREIATISPVFIGALFVSELVLPDPEPIPWWQMLVLALVLLGILILTGMYIGGRRQLHAALQSELASTRREQAALLDSAKTGERTRIAREMHDVLAHRLSLVALHSGALESRTDLSAEETSATAGVIRDNAHLALAELREVLGVLRNEPGRGDDAEAQVAQERSVPQPTLASLSDLLAESHVAGTPTKLKVEPALAAGLANLNDSTSRHLYRVVQEGLTNARKHALDQPVLVRIGGRPGHEVHAALSNPVDERQVRTGQPVSGVGLMGLTERVRLAGGQLSTGHDGRDGFSLKAELPWRTA